MSKGTQRRLAAIVCADVVGYSRLIGADEAGTLTTLRAHRAELIDPLIIEHGGRIVKTMGDGLLLEFPSVVGAVTCTLAVQAGIGDRNADVPVDRRIVFRVGVNLGDIVIDGEDIHGDGVNVAARLQETCAPGGLALSGVAYESLGTLVDAAFEDGGLQEFKNIARPVQVWRWSPEGADSAPDAAAPSTDLKLPGKPSIAVLPFDNMSGDPEQEYFSDGIAEDIITDLSKFSWLTVIARNSSFSFKGQAVDLRTVAKELGVRYVLEGSVRKAGARVRITAQLIDSRDGSHIWAERYNRELDDIFDLQDEMTQSISAAIAPELELMDTRRALGERPENLDAWDYVLRAKSASGLLNRESLAEAQRLAERALELQPGYNDALSFLAMFHALNASMGWTGSLEEDAEKAIQIAGEALKEKPGNINALSARGIAESMLGRHDQAVETLRQAVQNNPNYSFGHRVLARVLCYRGDYEDAVREAELALSLSPKDVFLHYSYYSLGFAHFADGNNHEAAKWAGKVIQDYPRFSPAFLTFAVASVELGDIDQAKSTVARFRLLEPETTILSVLKAFPAKDPELVERYTRALRTAGMPE